jgi:hypothetical protein
MSPFRASVPLTSQWKHFRFPAPEELLAFTRMTGEVIQRMRECPVPIIAAVHGMAAGAGLRRVPRGVHGGPRATLAGALTRMALSCSVPFGQDRA